MESGATLRLVWRAALAVVLMLGFYLVALAVIAALVVLPLLASRVSAGMAGQVGLFCVVGLYGVVRALLPRRDRFEPPGPRLTPDAQPRLFAEIRRVAAEVRQAEPAEVYLVPDVNAWVGHRGGLMGLGSRRVMGLGLPLLQVLTVRELRGVIAHEFGHFHGGDVAIGPWVYKTSAALMRMVSELHDHSEALTLPFVWYGNLFFRLTQAVSRHQEVLADRLATGVVGLRAFASGLRESHVAGVAFGPYWHNAVSPVLSAGFLPPLAAGFEAFLKTPWVVGKLAEAVKEDERVPAGPYDTHPPLPDRLAAVGVDPSSTDRDSGPAALTLLDGLPALESDLVDIAVRGKGDAGRQAHLTLDIAPDLPTLTPLAWAEVGARVWLPEWRRCTHANRKTLHGITPASLPELDWEALGRKITAGDPDANPLEVADGVVGAALALVLARAGFVVESHPASEPVLVGPADRVAVFSVRARLAQGAESPESWRSLCSRVGVADVDLGAAGERQSS